MSPQDSNHPSDQAAAPAQPRLALPLARLRLFFNAALASFAAYGFFPATLAWANRPAWALLGLGVSLLCVGIALLQLWPLLFPPDLAVFAPEGLSAPALFKGVIPWATIRSCERPGGKLGTTLRIVVAEGAYAGVSPRGVRPMRSDRFDLELAYGNINRKKAYEACSAFIAAARRDAPAGYFAYGRRKGDQTLEASRTGEVAAMLFVLLLCVLIAGRTAFVAYGLA